MKKKSFSESGIHSSKIYLDYIDNLVESIDQNIIVIDNKSKVVIWNSQMEAQFGSREKAIGQPLEDLFPTFWEEFREQVWGEVMFYNVLQKGESRELHRYPLKTARHKIRYFDLKASPLRSRNQESITGCILVMNDVTDRIYLENQLLRHAKTTSLANLGASVAHEVRNPLNSISLNIQLVKEGLQTPESSSKEEMVEVIDSVLQEIKRLNEIISSFLDFSRPPAFTMRLANINDIIRRVVKLLTEEARRYKVDILTHLEDVCDIKLDENQISQAIYNISLNAIQAMQEQGGGVLEIATLRSKGYILLEIKDNGPGITETDNSQLFDLFFSTREGGTGLGLPIANQIIEKHDGRIVAENNLDRGACFSIYLPVLESEKDE